MRPRSEQLAEKAMQQVDVTIIVVSYNTRELTLACLRSVFERTRRVAFEVIVVDNASADGSAAVIAAEFPQVRLFEPGANLGFAAANNFAAKHSKGEFLLLLNPDTQLLNDAAGAAIALARAHPRAGIVGGRTFFADGSLNRSSCQGRLTLWGTFCGSLGLAAAFPMSRLFDPGSFGDWRRDTVRDVETVSGCFMLIRRELWEQLGGFDEQFFMYGEEMDLCARARRLGAHVVMCPDAQLIHHGGMSEKHRDDKIVRLFDAKVRHFYKHWGSSRAFLGLCMLRVWAWTRILGFSLLSRVRPEARQLSGVWRNVWRRRAEWSARAARAGT